MRAVAAVVVVALGCSSKHADRRPPFATGFEPCRAAFAPESVRFTNLAAVLPACGELLGDGACHQAWNHLGTVTDVPSVAALLSPLLAACTKQYCRELATVPRACTTEPTAWQGHEIAVWTELHAAILDLRYSGSWQVSPDAVARYRALPEVPAMPDLVAVATEVGTPLPGATVEGREVVLGVSARLIDEALFRPVEVLSGQTPLPTH